MEIERTYLVNDVPRKIRPGKGTSIMQGYLSIEENAEVRIRRAGKKYVLTAKTGTGLEREETEVSITGAQFDILWPLTRGRRVEKERFVITLSDGNRAELDVFLGSVEGLLLVEVEFATAEGAAVFVPPEWFGPEVTDDYTFANSNLALQDGKEFSTALKAALSPIQHSVGAIPILPLNGENHVVVVTTRNGSRWIFPKGNPIEGIDDAAAACREAHEEAGVTGEITGKPIPVHYWKGYSHYIIDYYPLHVSTFHMEWEEHRDRTRRVCALEDIRDLVHDSTMVSAAEEFLARVG